MEFQIYIDGVDAYDYYRLSVAEGGYNDFACFPQLKDIPYNDWDEKNGIDPDLTAPVLDAKSVTIDCYIIGHISRYFDLMAALSDGAYHLFTFNEIGLEDKKLKEYILNISFLLLENSVKSSIAHFSSFIV